MKVFALLLALWPIFSFSQNCDQLPSASDFNIEVLESDVTGNAYDIDVAKDLKVYWVERFGQFRVYNPVTEQSATIATLDVHTDGAGWERANEGGLQGIALDPEFESNHWVYLYYSVPASELSSGVTANQLGPIERVSRFTLNQNNTSIVANSEKVIFEHTIFAQCCHHGGDLLWGPDSNLWITTGDNQNPSFSNGNPRDESQAYRDVQATSGNTNDYRGKVLRIRPLRFADSETPQPGVGTTYEIPTGNLFNSGTANTLPEIYTMGHRNPFSIAVLPEKNWLGIGEASGGLGDDEINVATEPGFFGWPYFSGENTSYSGSFNANNVMNNSSNNTGLTNLPNAVPASITKNTTPSMPENCMGVVLSWITYDPYLDSDVKFPPYLQGTLLSTMYGASNIYAASFDDNGAVTQLENLFSGSNTLRDIHRAIQGPDGAVYIAGGQYTFGASATSKIIKISYDGPCSTVEPLAIRDLEQRHKLAAYHPNIAHFGRTLVAMPAGARQFELFNLEGQKVWSYTRDESRMEHLEKIEVPAQIKKGVYQTRFQ